MSRHASVAVWKKIAASVAVLAGVSVFVSFGVFSAFSSTKANTSSLGAGTLRLSDNLGSAMLVNLSTLVPGDVVTRCVKVTNAGTVPAGVKLTPTATGALAGVITAKVQEGGGLTGTDGDCAGFVPSGHILGTSSGATTTASDLSATAAEDWQPGASKSYRLTLTLPATVTNELQGATGELQLKWDAEQKAGAER